MKGKTTTRTTASEGVDVSASWWSDAGAAVHAMSPADRASAVEHVLDVVERIRSRIPAWKRTLGEVRELAGGRGRTAEHDPDALRHALRVARHSWTPRDAYRELSGDHERGLATTRALVGEHAAHLAIALHEAASWWPAPARPEGGDGGAERPPAAGDAGEAVADDAQRTIAALDRAAQHALFLTFLRDANRARVGERLDIRDYCSDWGLSGEQVEEIWVWLVHDPARFGDRTLPLVVDRRNRCMYRKAQGAWQRLYTTTAALWGGAAAFGALVGLFALLDTAGLGERPGDWLPKLAVLLLFVTGGALLHVTARALLVRFDDPLEVYVAARGWDWISLRWLGLLRIYIPIAFVTGSLWGAGTIPATFQDLGVALLAGYSADSLFRASLERMRDQAKSGPGPARPASDDGQAAARTGLLGRRP